MILIHATAGCQCGNFPAAAENDSGVAQDTGGDADAGGGGFEPDSGADTADGGAGQFDGGSTGPGGGTDAGVDAGGGADGGSACLSTSCTTPPQATCLNGSTLRNYSGPGTCLTDGGCSYGFGDVSCPAGCNGSSCNPCVPASCGQLGFNCGTIDAGCGRTEFCGDCPWPQACGGGGRANVCGQSCGAPCSNWTECTTPGEGCDTARGCCVPCGASGSPCCVDFAQGYFFCGDGGPGLVCGRSSGTGMSTTYYCCRNQGDGCCQQGGCSGTGTCCKCPRNGLNFCVQSSFGCGPSCP